MRQAGLDFLINMLSGALMTSRPFSSQNTLLIFLIIFNGFIFILFFFFLFLFFFSFFLNICDRLKYVLGL